MSRRRDTSTGDLLAWTPPEVAVGYGPEVSGRGQLDNRIAKLVARALKDVRESVRKSRGDIAHEMSKYLGRRVSEEMLGKWASEASDHRIPLDAFIALIDAADTEELLGFVPELFGFVVVPEKYAGIIEMYLIEEHEKEVADRKSALSLRLRGLK